MANSPIFSFLIQEDDGDYNAYKRYTEPGSFNSGDELIKNIRIYNGANGQEVENSYDTKLVLSFKNYEDNFLLNLIQIQVNNTDFKKLDIESDRGSIDLGTIYKNSYVDVKIKIGPIPDNINSNLRSVIFYIENNKI